jgi:hypothetical protein
MMECTRKYLRILVMVLAGLALFGGLGACSKEEVREMLPERRSF